MFSKLGFPILTTYCGANFVPWWLGSFWYFLIDLIPGSSLALDCYAMYVWHFFLSDILLRSYIKGEYMYMLGDAACLYVNIYTWISYVDSRHMLVMIVSSFTILPADLVHVHWIRDAIQPSHPLSLSSPALNLSQHQGLFEWVHSLPHVAKVLEVWL